MRFLDGPWEGFDNGVPAERVEVGEVVDVPSRMRIGIEGAEPRWHTVSHIYEVIDYGAHAVYKFSQFESKVKAR